MTRTYTKTARAAAEQRTKDALLDAAEAAFFGEDWKAASLERLARDAGTTKQTLLRHFGSKEGLFEAAYARGFERVRAQRMDAPIGDIDAAVDNLLDHYAVHGRQGLQLAGLVSSEVTAQARELHYAWVERAFGRWLDAAPAAERERLRGLLIALCDVHTWNLLANDLSFDRGAVRKALILAIRRLLQEET